MDKVLQMIRGKPPFFLATSLFYLLLVVLLKWRLQPTLATLLFGIGVIVGIYFLDLAELFFKLSPSPFRSIVFQALFILVSFFIITSSGSALAAGLVLSVFLTLIFWQIEEWRRRGNLTSWYTMIAGPVSLVVQRRLLIIFVIFFLIETYLFVR